MAGDWQKIENVTPEKKEVLAMACTLDLDPDAVFGKLFRVWRWFDEQTEDGNATGVTKNMIDRIAGVTGFADAMKKEQWLVIDGEGAKLPNFDRHNGHTAKKRALTAKRVAKCKRTTNAGGNAHANAPVTHGALPREEKRREELKPSSNEEGCSEVAAPPSEPQTVAEPGFQKQTPTRPTSDPKTPSEVPLVILPCVGNGQKTWGFMPSMLPKFQEAYPALDIVAELKKAALWLTANPKKRKTRKGMLSFLAYWMSRAQNGGTGPGGANQKPVPKERDYV